MPSVTSWTPFGRPEEPPLELLHALAWYAREVLRLDRLFNAVTVKRRRNPEAPVQRRRSAFQDPRICLDFLAMAWLGATRLSHIEPQLRPRPELARAFGLRRFCDHTTAHNFLNGFHVPHLRQLAGVNARLLREHGAAAGQRAPILDLDGARRRVRRGGRRRDLTYRWTVAFCAGEAVAQSLRHRAAGWRHVVGESLRAARRALGGKPCLVRLAGPCASLPLFRELARQRTRVLASVTWAWALAHRPPPPRELRWMPLDGASRALDLGTAETPAGELRTVLLERPSPLPALRREREAIVTSMRDAPVPAISRLAASQARIRRFFGHARWPLGDGKMPSSDPRGNAAYLLLATIAMNVLQLFARHLGDGWTLPRVRDRLRFVPRTDRGGRRPAGTAAGSASPR
ncbi:MAG: hypothetical protein ACLF0G_14970 [Candidatus Brocadiia bacterium]